MSQVESAPCSTAPSTSTSHPALTQARSALTQARSAEAAAAFDALAGRVRAAAAPDVAPCFFHNLQRSLLEKLPAMVAAQAGSAPRNYIALGSGLFDAPGSAARGRRHDDHHSTQGRAYPQT